MMKSQYFLHSCSKKELLHFISQTFMDFFYILNLVVFFLKQTNYPLTLGLLGIRLL